MLEILLSPHATGNPAGIRNPMVLFGEPFFEKGIMDRAGKRNVDHAANVNVPNLTFSKTKFSASETVRINGNPVPGAYDLLKSPEIMHRIFPSHFLDAY